MKSRELSCDLFSGNASNPLYGVKLAYLEVVRCRTTSSEAYAQLCKILLTVRLNPRLAASKEHFNDLDLTKYTPRYCAIQQSMSDYDHQNL